MALGIVMWVGPPLWSRPKYLGNYLMDCCEILYRYSWSSQDEPYWLWWSSDFYSSATIRLTFVIQSEISWQVLDGLLWNLDILTSRVPRGPSDFRRKVNFNKSLYWNILISIGWLAVKFDTHIHIPQRMNYKNFDLLYFHLVPSWSEFHFVQYFGLWANTFKTNGSPISLSCTLCLVLTSKCCAC